MQGFNKFERWWQDLQGRQRNYVFPDTARNMAGFWGGLYRQKLNSLQTVGFFVLIIFYLVFIGALIFSEWKSLRVGYWVYLLLCLPLLGFFLVMRRSLRRDQEMKRRAR